MIFGEVETATAEGAILAHAVRLPSRVLKKGRRLTAKEVALLKSEGVATVMVARIEPGDVAEDEAARRVAEIIAGPGLRLERPFTGRCNLFATAHGLALIDRERLDALNRIDEGVTVATVAPFDVVELGQMAATVKIIPFAVAGEVIARCRAAAVSAAEPIVRVQPFQASEVGLLLTTIPGTPDRGLELAAENVRARVESLGGRLKQTITAPHRAEAIASGIIQLLDGGAEMVLIFGAVSTLDRRDVVPAGIVAAGGAVEHLGMPVDPGNLLVLARRGPVPVIGLPGCVRSPRLNGFDWVLQRLFAGLAVTGDDIAAMGAGGLLKEILDRPQPRAGDAPSKRPPKIATLVLAAGQSRRMGGANKLTSIVEDRAMVTYPVRAALAAKAAPVVVVTGFAAEEVRAALDGLDVTVAHNPDFAAGMSTSLKAGIAALPRDVDGVLVCLGDMPRVTTAHLGRLIAAFDPVEGRAVCVPTHRGKRGNPILWARRFFRAMGGLSGDVGARALLAEHAELVCEVPMEDDGVLFDVDTPQGLTQAKAGAVSPP